jgi:hypothetical protein
MVVVYSCLRRQRYGNGAGYDHRYAAADETGCERRQSIQLVLRIPILDRHVPALDIAGFLQALEKRNGGVLVVNFSGLGAEEPDHRQRPLLRVRRDWPRGRRPAEPRNELPPSHSSSPGPLSRVRSEIGNSTRMRQSFSCYFS